jgi:hypothetical protein
MATFILTTRAKALSKDLLMKAEKIEMGFTHQAKSHRQMEI